MNYWLGRNNNDGDDNEYGSS
ncbi:hypothetical protein PMI14_01192, partial [Acidovorax sp. CF316]